MLFLAMPLGSAGPAPPPWKAHGEEASFESNSSRDQQPCSLACSFLATVTRSLCARGSRVLLLFCNGDFKMLDLADFITERGGDPNKIKASQRKRFAPESDVDEVIALYEEARKGIIVPNDCAQP